MVTDHRLGSSVTVRKDTNIVNLKLKLRHSEADKQVGRISDWLTGQQGFSVLENFGAELRAEEKKAKLTSLLQEGSGDKSKRSKKTK